MSDKSFWRKWARAQRRELQDGGVSRKNAKIIAKQSAEHRKSLQKVVGREAAAGREVITRIRGNASVQLMIPIDTVQPEYLPRAEAWAAGPTHSIVQ